MKKGSVGIMRTHIAWFSVLFFFAFSYWAPLHGAEPSQATARSSYALLKKTNEFGLWVGGSPSSSRGRNLLLVGLRYGRVLATWESVSLEYTLDVLPAAVVFQPGRIRGKSSIYGGGVSPLGFKLNFGPRNRIKPFLAGSVGFLYFEEDVPVPDSSRFNFTQEVGLGMQFFLTEKRAVTLGYKFHHISNAGISENNAGMNSHIIYGSFSFFTP